MRPGGRAAIGRSPGPDRGALLISAGDGPARDIAAVAVSDLTAADGNLADRVDPAARHGDLHRPVAIGESDRIATEGVGRRDAIDEGAGATRDDDADPLLPLPGIARDHLAFEHVAGEGRPG